MSYLKSRLHLAKVFLCGIFLIAGFSALQLQAQGPGQFKIVGNFKNIGLVVASVVGPGPLPGSQRLYASIAYNAGSFDILAIDPETGATVVLRSPLASETAAWGMVLGPDGNIYIGTAPGAHFFKLDTAKGILIDLGTPDSNEEYIWAVAFGSDRRLYGGTFPGCKLVRYDPATGQLDDLGKLDSTQQYARYLASTANGFLYAGIGSAAARVVAYQISTGAKQQILPAEAQDAGFAHAYVGKDGSVYALTNLFDYRLSGWQATKIPEESVPDPDDEDHLSDGRTGTLDEEDGKLVLHLHADGDNDSDDSFTLDYTGETNQLFRIGLGSDGSLYGSGALPSDLVRFRNDGSTEYIGGLGNGEAYSMLASGSDLLLATYSDLATLISYNPSRPFSTAAGSANPQLPAIPDGDICWRPEAMVSAPNGMVYVGAQAGYGELGGPLISWNPADSTIHHWSVIPNQGVVSLAVWKDIIVGGTTIQGGPGSQAEATDAQLFLWDPKSEEVIWQAVPVPGAKTITDLVTAPNGLVYGFADKTLFELDPSVPAVLRTRSTSVTGLIYNSVAVDQFGRIWGLSSQDVFTLDTIQLQETTAATTPAKITGGFALSGQNLYFIAGSAVYAYGLADWGFTLQNASPSATVAAGGEAEFTLTVAAKGGFDGTVLLSCAGLPKGTACSFSPSSVASNGATLLTISTTAPSATPTFKRSRGSILGLAVPCMWLMLAGLRKRRIVFAKALLALALIHVLSGCAEYVLNSGSAPPPAGATPAGTYSITVSATSVAGGTSITQASVITLTVK